MEHFDLVRRLHLRLTRMILAAEKGDFRDLLEKLQYDLLYQAPEAINIWGDKVADLLYNTFGEEPAEDWQKQVIKYWMEILDKDNNAYKNENIVFDKLPQKHLTPENN